MFNTHLDAKGVISCLIFVYLNDKQVQNYETSAASRFFGANYVDRNARVHIVNFRLRLLFSDVS